MELFSYLALLLALLVRWLVSRFPYSGCDKPPMYGDYEAQRHWMEITIHTSSQDWYRNTTNNDLMYWGLDYPPLSAYHSFVNGKISQWINPEWVQLFKSRGYESYNHKLFMRSSVILMDILVYFTALYAYWSQLKGVKNRIRSIHFASSLLYPGIILIDHGHFQYNSISLGLTIWAVVFLCQKKELLASIAFVLALNYKHLSLYHGMPFFCYLLGQALLLPSIFQKFFKILKLAFVVITTFAIIWLPFLNSIEDTMVVIRRLFPVNRGLFEDKVANIWCSLNVFFKFRDHFTNEKMAFISLIVTSILLLPSSIHLLINPKLKVLKYALVNSSFIFFLVSFQVHEKQILLVSTAIMLLMHEHPLSTFWFFIVSTFSLHPLLIKDGLALPYFVFQIFLIFIYLAINGDLGLKNPTSFMQKTRTLGFVASFVVCTIVSIAQQLFRPPIRYPDIYSLLNASISCIHFIGFLIFYHYCQFKVDNNDDEESFEEMESFYISDQPEKSKMKRH